MVIEPIRYIDRIVFGENAERCQITGRVYETGIGSMPREVQIMNFIREAPTEFQVPWKAAFDALTKAEAEGFKP